MHALLVSELFNVLTETIDFRRPSDVRVRVSIAVVAGLCSSDTFGFPVFLAVADLSVTRCRDEGFRDSCWGWL